MLKLLLLLAALCLLCAAPSLAHGSFVYVTNYGDGTISQFRANPNGTLTPLNPPSVKAYPRCHSLAVARGHFLYALSSLEFSRRNCLLSQFRVGIDGNLTPLSPATVQLPYDGEGGGPDLVVVDPSGRFAYVPGRGTALAQFQITGDGTLGPLNPSEAWVSGGTLHTSVAFDSQHRLLYIAKQSYMSTANAGEVKALAISESGILHPLPEGVLSMEGLTPESVLVSHGGRYVYLQYNTFFGSSTLRSGGTYKVVLAQYQTQATGKLVPLTPHQVSLFGTADTALVDPYSRFCSLVVYDTLGQFGYQHPSKHRRLVRFVIRNDGTLGRLYTQSLPVQGNVSDAIFAPTGSFLYLLTGSGVRPFRVHTNGSVSSIGARSIRAGRGPLGMVYVQQ